MELSTKADEWLCLAPAQAWFFEQGPKNLHSYNQSLVLRFRDPIDLAFARALLTHVASRHDVFGLRFQRRGDVWRQSFQAISEVPITLDEAGAEISEAEHIKQVLDRLDTTLNIETGPLARAALLTRPGGASILLIVAHHLIVDEVSWRILLEELHETASDLRRGIPAKRDKSVASFASWVQYLCAETPNWADEVSFWATRAPYDPFTETHPRRAGGRLIRVPEEITRPLLTLATRSDWTIDHLILSAVTTGLCRALGVPGISIDIETHGRSDSISHVDVSRSVGWFTAIWPFDIAHVDQSILNRASDIARRYSGIPREGVAFGPLRYIARVSELASLPRSPILFTYLGRTDRSAVPNQLFESIRVPHSDNHRSQFNSTPYLLILNSWIENNQLILDCHWKLGNGEAHRVEAGLVDATASLAESVLAQELASIETPARAAPQTATERLVFDAWNEVLAAALSSESEAMEFGIDDDFSVLGGDSIHMIQIVSRLRRTFKVRVPLRVMAEFKTVRTLSSKIDAVTAGDDRF